MLLKTVLVFLLATSYCNAGILDRLSSWWNDDSSRPSFCNNNDCPRFTVIESTDDYEVRNYSYPTNWVSTKAKDYSMEEVKRTMFWRLFKYISGNNTRGEKIAMTVPVTTLVTHCNGPPCKSDFTMSFFIADSISNPPTPGNPLVYLTKMKPTVMYVRSFGGYAYEQQYREEARNLARALPSKYTYKRGLYYSVGYDAPYKFWKRHNEVWFIAGN